MLWSIWDSYKALYCTFGYKKIYKCASQWDTEHASLATVRNQLESNRCRLWPTGDTERSQVRTKRLQWRRYQAVVRIRAWSHIISSRCCLQLPGQRTGWCGEPSPLVPPAGRTAPSPPGCQRAAPRSGRPCLWAAALAGLPCCARFRSQNTQRDLKKIKIKSSLRA